MPVDLGHLRSTARSFKFSDGNAGVIYSATYAAKQHEGYYRHKVGERRYLTNALVEKKDEVVKAVAKAMLGED